MGDLLRSLQTTADGWPFMGGTPEKGELPMAYRVVRGFVNAYCSRKGPLIIIKFPSLLLVRSRAARACLSVTFMVRHRHGGGTQAGPRAPGVTGPPRPAGYWNGPVTWQARSLWPPGPRQSAVVAGPRLAESARGRVYGRPGPGPAAQSGGLTA
jgi:hypothetical protein